MSKIEFSKFFKAPQAKYSDYQRVLIESSALETWETAVKLFRDGTSKLRSNDISGYEDIKKANESLKQIATVHPKQPIEEGIAKLSESVVSYETEKKLEKIVESVKAFALVLKENAVIAEVPKLEEEVPGTAPCEQKIDEDAVDDDAAPTTSGSTCEAPVKGASAIIDTPHPGQTGPTSSFEKGFAEARKRFKAGENPKNMARQMAESELSKESYSHVTRWMEGFNAGWQMEEEVQKDLNPAAPANPNAEVVK